MRTIALIVFDPQDLFRIFAGLGLERVGLLLDAFFSFEVEWISIGVGAVGSVDGRVPVSRFRSERIGWFGVYVVSVRVLLLNFGWCRVCLLYTSDAADE